MKLGPDVYLYYFSDINIEDKNLYSLYDDYHKGSKGQPVGPEGEEPPTPATDLDT